MFSIGVLFVFAVCLLMYESKHRLQIINGKDVKKIPPLARSRLERQGVARSDLMQAYAAECEEGILGFMVRRPVLSAVCYCLVVSMVLLLVGVFVR